MKTPLAQSRLTSLGSIAFPVGLVSLGMATALWAAASSVGEALNAGAITGLALAFFIARIVPLRLPQGDRVRITVVVGVAGLCLQGAGEVLVAALAAGAVDLVVRIARDGIAASRNCVRDVIRSVAILALLSPWQLVIGSAMVSPAAGDTALIAGVIVGISYAALDILTLAVQQWIAGGFSVLGGIGSLARSLGSIYLVHIAMAAVVLRVYPSLGAWGLAIALLLTLILQNSFGLYLRTRRAYSQTIRALAHAAELDRPKDAGHAERVADLAVAVARARGLSSVDLERVGYAALLHDVGRIGYDAEGSDAWHPVRGADIVDTVPYLEGVAPLIRHHRNADDPAVPEGAIIVGICCRYDRLRADIGAGAALSRLEAEERGHRSWAVKSLASIVMRRSGLSTATETVS